MRKALLLLPLLLLMLLQAAAAEDGVRELPLQVGGCYVFENTGSKDAVVTAMGGKSSNARADWLFLDADGEAFSWGNGAFICYLKNAGYTLGPGEKMIVKPLESQYNRTEIWFRYPEQVTLSHSDIEPLRRFLLTKGEAVCFLNETQEPQSLLFSGDINAGKFGSANMLADALLLNADGSVQSVRCKAYITYLNNTQLTLQPGQSYLFKPLSDQTSKDYIVAFVPSVGFSGRVTFIPEAEEPVRRFEFEEGLGYHIRNASNEDVRLYMSASHSANARASFTVYQGEELVRTYRKHYVVYTSDTSWIIAPGQEWYLVPTDSRLVAFVPGTLPEETLEVTPLVYAD